MSDSGDKRTRASAVITVHRYEPSAYDEPAHPGHGGRRPAAIVLCRAVMPGHGLASRLPDVRPGAPRDGRQGAPRRFDPECLEIEPKI
jgi:hypothetical protein